MKMNQAYESKYLKADSNEIPSEGDVVLTIRHVQIETLKKDDGTEESKPILYFSEHELPMVLNKTNWGRITQALGSDDSDDWLGKQVAVYSEDVEYAGKMMRGLRIRPRAPKRQAAPQQAAATAPRAAQQQPAAPRRMTQADVDAPVEDSDDVPF